MNRVDVVRCWPFPEQGIDSDGGFVEDKQFGFVEESDGEGHSPLLAAAERLDGAVRRRQIQQFEQKLHLRLDEGGWQLVDTTEVLERLLDAEFAVQGQFLGHVAHSTPRDAALGRPGFAAEHHHFAAVETASTHDAAQQRRFTATTCPQ